MLNIHLKIESKKLMKLPIEYHLAHNLKASEFLNLWYSAFDRDFFLLPYKVKKLSKHARRNKLTKNYVMYFYDRKF